MSSRVWIPGLGAVAAAVLLAGCSVGLAGGGASGAPVSAAPASAPASSSETLSPAPTSSGSSEADPTATGSTESGAGASASVGGGRAALPEDFPVPNGADVGTVVRDENQIAAQITLTDPAAAYDFWRSALPKAGYTVTKAESVNATFGEIRFRGHGCAGNSQIAVAGGTAAVQCDLG